MDRNLGATNNDLSTAAYGLLYQWGRKDPFAGGVANSAGYAAQNSFSFGSGNIVTNTTADAAGVAAGIIESIQNPTKFYAPVDNYDWLPARENTLWRASDGKKTIYDPCPSGWRVPAFKENQTDVEHSPWMEYDNTTYAEELAKTEPRKWVKTATQKGYIFTHKDGTNTYYPAIGVRAINGGLYYSSDIGVYWAGNHKAEQGSSLYFHYAGVVTADYSQPKCSGYSVRCVQDKPGP
jgi:uncharacterized protein (TIGR02145 family)